MAIKRFIDNPLLKKFDRVAVPLTDLNDGKDYQAGVDELAKIVLKGGRLENYWDMQADVLPTCRSFSDPEYLTAGTWFFEDISNTEQKPDKLEGKTVQFARLLCEAGRSETEGLNFVKQYLFYINMTDNELELSMRGVLMNGGGEVQGATPWKTGVDQADTAKEAAHAVNADNATEAAHAVNADNATNATNATNAQEAAHAAAADNATSATNATTAETATNAGYAGNSAMLGGVAANKYALKSDTLTLEGITRGARSLSAIGEGRNLIDVLGASSVPDCFQKLKALGNNYSKLLIGDYIDIPTMTVSGIGVLNNDYNNLRVEIAGFDHYYRVGDTETERGILFVFRHCAFTHGMNSSNTNSGGYNSAQLKTIVNRDLAAGIEAAIGVTLKTVHRLVDTHGSWAWTAEKCWIPSEVEVIGHQAWGRGGYYTGTSVQYPIYAIDPSRRLKNYNGNRQWYWEGTSDSGGSTYFCLVSDYGNASDFSASYGSGVSAAFYL